MNNWKKCSVSQLSGVVPSYLADAWVAVTDGTELDGVEFVIEELEGTAACMDCGEEFPVNLTSTIKCPSCGSAKVTPLTGRDLTLKEILAT